MCVYHSIAVIGCLFLSCPQRIPIGFFEENVGRELRKQDACAKNRLNALLRRVLPKRYYPRGNLENWYLWQIRADEGYLRYALIQVCGSIEGTGESFVVFHSFDRRGKLLGSSELSTGSRIRVRSAKINKDVELNGLVLTIQCAPMRYGPEIYKQFYGIRSDRVILLRIEDSKGNVVPNNYNNPNYTVGPEVPLRACKAWRQALRAKDYFAVLEALVWLGGRHRSDLGPIAKDIGIEDLKLARRFAEVRKFDGVEAAIRSLQKSENKWVQQAAASALKGFGH